MKTGHIQVQTENIFPIIKKFLYSDQDIFLRELVSNATDALQKLRVLSSTGEAKGDLGELRIDISIDREKGTLTISDTGIGMTEEETEKYLNQVAFSGAREFLEKYSDKPESQQIIGHFGLGFYSAFMVSSKVQVLSRSYQSDTAVLWECEGSPEYSLTTAERNQRGTDIILHINEDSLEYLESNRIKDILEKYGRFLPFPLWFEDQQVNNTNPAWTRKPSELSDEDYTNFYKELFPHALTEPLFHIHLNVDYPFNLTGVLYFPRTSSRMDMQRHNISLYSRQVFITDNVDGIVPEYLMLLHGVIDSPDIPLNVSRSYLQADSNVKKISAHISKKVADKLSEKFRADRKDFAEKWEEIKLFIQYGTVTDEKFAERSRDFILLENTDGEHFTISEYIEKVKPAQEDKHGKIILLYTHHTESHLAYIKAARSRGNDVLVMNSPIESHFISKLESLFPEVSFVRVDADSLDKLIDKDHTTISLLDEQQLEILKQTFEPVGQGTQFRLRYEDLSETDMPVMITQAEFLRRMNEMNAVSGGSTSGMFDMYDVVINKNHPAMLRLLDETSEENRHSKARYLVDLAKLGKGMLKGEDLEHFISQSMENI